MASGEAITTEAFHPHHLDPEEFKQQPQTPPHSDFGTLSPTFSRGTHYGEPKVYTRRFFIIILFASYSAINAFQWIHLNIIGDKVLLYYEKSLPSTDHAKNVALDWLSMVYMLAYIPLIVPANWLLDRKGLHAMGMIGTFLNAAGASIKCLAIHPSRFAIVMFGQSVCAIAQVFILGLPARVAAVWFGANEVSTATAVGVFGNQIGCAIGFLIPPIIVDNLDESIISSHCNTTIPHLNNTSPLSTNQYNDTQSGLITTTMTTDPCVHDLEMKHIEQRLIILLSSGACISIVLFILVVIFFKKKPEIPPSVAQLVIHNLEVSLSTSQASQYFKSLGRLLKNIPFCILLVTYGINTGSYYAIGTLLNPIILYYFPSEQLNAGRIGLTLVMAGVLGSLLSGMWLDRTKWYKFTTVLIYFLSCVGMLAFTFFLIYGNIIVVFICGFFLGFFMTGYLPVGFEFAAELTFPESEGSSSGLLNASAQIFGIIFTLSIRLLTTSVDNGMLAGNLTITFILLAGAFGTLIIKSNLKRQKAYAQVDILETNQLNA